MKAILAGLSVEWLEENGFRRDPCFVRCNDRQAIDNEYVVVDFITLDVLRSDVDDIVGQSYCKLRIHTTSGSAGSLKQHNRLPR